MKEIDEEEVLSRKYLLGELDEAERQQVEQRLVNDPEYFSRVSMLEDELVEDFAFNALSKHDREGVARRLLSTPQQVKKLEITRAIKEYAEARGAESTSVVSKNPLPAFLQEHRLAVGLSLAASLILAFAVFWTLTRDPLEQELAQLNRASDSYSDDRADPSVYQINLTTRRFRSVAGAPQEERKGVVIPREARVVQLRVLLEMGSSQSYRVVLEKDDGEKVFTLDNLSAVVADGGQQLAVKLPARILNRGYYQLTISRPGKSDEQFEHIGTYDFQVVDKE